MRAEDEWILTYSGKAYWPLNPSPDDVRIEDIAHGLSMLCRYAGQTSSFYSVAEHSVLVSYMVPPAFALEALLHDATEAYCSDVVRPLKKMLPDYQRIERLNDLAIREHFRLCPYEHPLVKQADTDIVETEKSLLPTLPEGRVWKTGGTLNPSVYLRCWSPALAEVRFLGRFRKLISNQGGHHDPSSGANVSCEASGVRARICERPDGDLG